jgi:hypothetical protein
MGAWHDTHFLQDICELGACFGKTTTDPVLGMAGLVKISATKDLMKLQRAL